MKKIVIGVGIVIGFGLIALVVKLTNADSGHWNIVEIEGKFIASVKATEEETLSFVCLGDGVLSVYYDNEVRMVSPLDGGNWVPVTYRFTTSSGQNSKVYEGEWFGSLGKTGVALFEREAEDFMWVFYHSDASTFLILVRAYNKNHSSEFRVKGHRKAIEFVGSKCGRSPK